MYKRQVFGTEKLTDDQALETLSTQHSVGFSMDSLIKTFDLPFPTKLKMDVIGTQGKVRALTRLGTTHAPGPPPSLLEVRPFSREETEREDRRIIARPDEINMDAPKIR